MQKLYELTRQATGKGAQMVIWPEGALYFDPRTNRTQEIRDLVRETGVYLVLGYGLRTAQGLTNEATVVAPDGRFLGVYGKDHPVIWMGETSLTRGTYPTYDTALGTIGALMAEDIPHDLVARARHLHVGSTALQPRLRVGLPDVFRHARASGTTTSFDANWDPDERWEDLDGLLATADVCFPNLAEGRLSAESPIGRALIDAAVGATVEVETPRGVRAFKVVKLV